MTTATKQIAVLVGALLLAQTCHAADTAKEFVDNLGKICGATFEGVASVVPVDAKELWTDKKLVATIASCTADEVRVPLHVGENRSRTWIIQRKPGGLTLAHDHRHEDGTPDKQTMYGGPAGAGGTPYAQHFYPDEYTVNLIKGSATNIWHISMSPDGSTLTYFLERDGKPRLIAELKRKQ
jgi:hypothetical protein